MDTHLAGIGQLISLLRERDGVTQQELAKRLKTTQSAIARMEKGEQNLTAEMLFKVNHALSKDIVQLASSAINIRIEGGRPLSGSITVKTSKNGAVALLCASLLNKGKTILKNVPKIEEVHRVIEVLESIGVKITWRENDLEIRPPEKIDLTKINKESAARTRSIVMFIGPLIHKARQFALPQAGGCKLGSRTVKPHFFALEKLGVDIKTTETEYLIKSKRLAPAEIVLYESGDTVTENALMAAALIPGQTTIRYASANYQVQELCFFLEQLGVKIEGIGTSTLIVRGVREINSSVEYMLAEDPIEAMFFLAVSIVTNSSITIARAPIRFIELELLKLQKMGFKYKIRKSYKAHNGKTDLVDILTYPSKLKALEEKIHPNVYPGLNIDNLPFFAVIATQAKGQTIIHDWVYEKRAIYYKELDKLGADTILADPHRIYINGPTPLKSNEVICPPALRPAAILLVGMLGAKGVSTLRNIYSINRGYEGLIERLNSIGAKITILREF